MDGDINKGKFFKKFIDMVSDFMIQITLQKLPLVEFWCSNKEYPPLPSKGS